MLARPHDHFRRPKPVVLARGQGAFNVVFGLWPLVHRSSFEAVFGSKVDRWLMHTVAGLMIGNGLVQATARVDQGGMSAARWVGVSVATTLAAIDLVYVPRGRISPSYLLDAVAEVGWLLRGPRQGQ
jgi:hypothetical protein